MSINTTAPLVPTTEVIEVELEKNVLAAPQKAAELKITSAETYVLAAELGKTIKGWEKEIKAIHDPICDERHRLHKEATNRRGKYLTALAAAESRIKDAMRKWDEEQERIRLAEERRIQEEVRKREEEARLAEAVHLESAGETEAADSLLEEPIQAPTVVLPKATPKVSGVSGRKPLKWRIKDESKIDRKYMTVDPVKINAEIRISGKKAETIVGGIDVYEETNYAFTAGK